MKVQNTVTLPQAQSLDEAIKGAGLEWPGIEWADTWGLYKSAIPEIFPESWELDSGQDIEDFEEFRIKHIPAPNLAELAAMIPPTYFGFPVKVKVSRLKPSELIEMIKNGLSNDWRGKIKSHWETINQIKA